MGQDFNKLSKKYEESQKENSMLKKKVELLEDSRLRLNKEIVCTKEEIKSLHSSRTFQG